MKALTLTLLLVSQLSFASEFTFTPIPLLLNPVEGAQSSLDTPTADENSTTVSKKRKREDDPKEANKKPKREEEPKESEPSEGNAPSESVIFSNRNTRFTITAQELSSILSMIPEGAAVEASDGFHLKLTTTAIYLLLQYVRGNTREAENFLINLSDERLNILEREATYFRLKAIGQFFKDYAKFRIKPSDQAKAIQIKIEIFENGRLHEANEMELSDLLKDYDEKEIIINDTPVKELKTYKISVGNQSFQMVNSQLIHFEFGRFLLFCPYCPYTSVALDATLPALDALANEFVLGITDFNPESILVEFGRFLHKKVPIVDKMAIQRVIKEGPVCRHFSLYGAVLLSKIFRLMGTLAEDWTIQILSSRTFTRTLSRVPKQAHTWNFVTVSTAKGKQYYVYDIMNVFIVELDLEKIKVELSVDGLRAIEFRGDTRTFALNSHVLSRYVILTVQRYFHKQLGLKTMFSDERVIEQLGKHLREKHVDEEKQINIVRYFETPEDQEDSKK